MQDAVSSKKLERFGKYETAEGYLDAFSRFVKENADKVDALSILLKRPRDWRPKALEELRRTLAQNQFDERKLQEAHKISSHKALADVISIVKHAATAQAPVLTAEERVNHADGIAGGETRIQYRTVAMALAHPRAPGQKSLLG